MRTLEVDALGVGFDDIGCHITGDVEYAAVVLYGVLVVHGCVVEFFGVLEAVFFEFDKTFHQGMRQMEIYLRMVSIVVCHISYLLFCL